MNTFTSEANTHSTSHPSAPDIKVHGYAGVMHDRQIGLSKAYRQAPEQAWILDVARTGLGHCEISDPLHADVHVAGVDIPLGLHPAVGGDGDGPVPGELLSAALAGCMDSTIRVVASRLSIEIKHLEVIASAEIDVRGTLRLSQKVPVGFQKIHLSVDIETAPGTKPSMVKALLQAAEYSCVVMQTLKNPPEISTQFNTDNA